MQLIDEWKTVASKAWSVRLLAGAGLLQLLDLLAQLSVVLPQLDGILPARTFQALSLLCVLASLVARFVHQPEMHPEPLDVDLSA